MAARRSYNRTAGTGSAWGMGSMVAACGLIARPASFVTWTRKHGNRIEHVAVAAHLHLRQVTHLRLPGLSPEMIPNEELCVRLVTLQSTCIFSHGGSDVIRALSVLAWLGVLAKQRAPSVDAIISTCWHVLPKFAGPRLSNCRDGVASALEVPPRQVTDN